ncbi:MAG: hypothetical protein ABI859_19965 [Pseudomonadota bacterium]
MKIVPKALLLLLALTVTPAFSQEIAGIWQGKLAVAPTQTLTIQFSFTKKPDGTYAAVLNSPDGAIKDVAANAVTLNAGALKVDVTSLSGSYAGTFKDGSFDGKWTQPGGVLPLTLAPYQKPQLSAAALKTLQGTWHGPVTTPIGTLTFVTRFKTDAKGELQGTLAVQEQGGNEIPASDIEFANDKLSFKIPRVGGTYTATYSKDTLTGTWKQPGPGAPPEGIPVTLKKGDVAATVYPLKLSTEAFAAVNGKWQGRLVVPQAPNGGLTIVVRFETNANGQYVGFVDSPDQGAKGLLISEAAFAAGKLTFKTLLPPAEYSGTLAGKTVTGEWKQGPGALPLVLTRQ